MLNVRQSKVMYQNDEGDLMSIGISFLVISIIMVVLPAVIFGLPF